MRTIGNYPNNVNWIWWDAPSLYLVSQNGANVNATNDEGLPVVSSDGEVTVIPRIDSYFNRDNQGGGFLRFDYNFSLGLYQEQCKYVVQHKDQVNLILVYSWNEYHERTEIEPHSDWTAQDVSLFYLTNLTSHYINEMK